jgi:hypothetical protein
MEIRKTFITTIHGSLTRFSNKKIPKMTGVKKPPCQLEQINLDLPTQLGSQFGPCLYHWQCD